MAGKIIKRKGLVFEVWIKSLCLREPVTSPTFASSLDLTNEENALKAIDDFISIMNIGIDIYQSRRI